MWDLRSLHRGVKNITVENDMYLFLKEEGIITLAINATTRTLDFNGSQNILVLNIICFCVFIKESFSANFWEQFLVFISLRRAAEFNILISPDLWGQTAFLRSLG